MIDRAHLAAARLGPGLAALDAEVARCLDVLGQGAARIDPPALLSADTLLDLYGEDMRGRAYITADPDGERMLRPDFTVPVVEAHLGAGGGAGSYVYAGPVWRRQPPGSTRPTEYLQVGVEMFGDAGAVAEAEVFARLHAATAGAGLVAEIGDLGLLASAIDALDASDVRKAALRRHLWRPARFARLLDRFGAGHDRFVADKAALVADWRAGRLDRTIAAAGAPVGLRGADEIADRVARLAEEAEAAPLAAAEVERISALLALSCPADAAPDRLAAICGTAPRMRAAVDRFAARLDAFAARGIDPAALTLRGAFGRTTLEYYDGFVFGFLAPGRDDLPVIASGGRYDALTAALGGPLPAVGGILRPEALLAARGGVG